MVIIIKGELVLVKFLKLFQISQSQIIINEKNLGQIINWAISQCYKKCGNQIIKWHNQLCDQITCQAGYQNVENQCISICGDLLLQGDEECEDGNLIVNDGCTNCKFQCPKQCLTCNLLTIFPCSDICGDGIISGLEECDDANNNQFDGCYQCKLECQASCTRCIRGLCYECLTLGWIINIDTLQCIENCGDSIVIGSEECDDGNNLDENDNCYQCKRLCRNDCKTCSPDGKNCLDCQAIGFKPQSYYCVNICGDGYLAVDPYGRNTEECDDFNLVGNDGCSTSCRYQCQTSICKVCQNGKCLECIDHYYLNTNNNKCLEICNDNVKVGNEKCEDMNTLLNDGCYNCQLSCQPSCLNCQIIGCLQCQVGFRLIENKCQNICGDELIVSGEDCDDGNINPFDGCHFCQFYCDPNCQVCQSGRCLGCQLGFKLFNGICVIQVNINNLITQQEQFLYQNYKSQSYIQYCHYQINDVCIICDDYYYLNAIRSKCESKCGDNYINDLEQCEHNLKQNHIICSNCQFQCKDNCIECMFGLCQYCEQDYILIEQTNECLLKSKCDPEYGLYYNVLINQCYDICGDGVKSIYEECEDDNVDPYDGCFLCKYSCNPICPLCIAGVCTDDGTACQKGYYFDKSNGSCFSACGDGIKAIPDEECDLLNTRKCLNCKLIIDKNCKILDENNLCLVCQDGFELLDELCEPETNKKCDIQNCIACENNICIQYLTDPINNTNTNNNTLENVIQAQCGDGNINQNELCDDGNLIDGDGCDSNCLPSKNSLCQLNECIQIFHPVPQLKFVKSIENCQILTLFYDQKVRLSPGSTVEQYLNSLQGSVLNIKLNVTIEANSKPSQDFDYFEILIQIQYLEKVVDPVFFLNFQNLSIIINEQELEQECQQLSIQLASPNFLSIEEQQTTKSLIQFSEYQIQIIVGLVLISSLSGKFQIIENQIEMMQMLYYYKYINIIKGQNLIKFFDTFKIIQLANLYEFIGFSPKSFNIFTYSQKNSPSIFEDDGRTSNFFCAFLEIFSIFFVAYFSHLFSQIIIKQIITHITYFNTETLKLYQLKLLNKLAKVCKKNYGNQFKEQFKIIFQSLIYEYIINTMLSFQYQNKYNLEGMISLTLKIILFILIIFYLVNKQNQKFSEFQYTYSCIQKIMFSLILVGCFECPIIQIQLCAVNELIYFSFLFLKRNKLEKLEGFKKLFKHLTFVFMNLNYLIHEFYKRSPQNLVTLGWIQVGIMSCILSLTLILDIYTLLQPIILKVGQTLLQKYFKQQTKRFANHQIFDQGDSNIKPSAIRRVLYK